MTKALSPLRYPGGKSCLAWLLKSILRENHLEHCHYVEPYAGGCGLALALLHEGCVSDIHVNDLDFSIWAFWNCVLNHTEELVQLIEKTPVTISEWYKQKEIHNLCDQKDPLGVAFSTFFLNRTNRSGIIKKAGVIGGFEQKGNYKIDCRYNREGLIKRIRIIAQYRNQIHLTNLDAIPFMKNLNDELPPNSLFCIDPPYFNKGSSLYTNYYGPNEHGNVAETILNLTLPWIVTYDNTLEIKKLYSNCQQFTFNINYSMQTKRIGSELLIVSNILNLPTEHQKNQAIHSAASKKQLFVLTDTD